MKTVNLELVKTALEKVSGTQFEHFANAAFAELIGPDFIPLGGYPPGRVSWRSSE
jgi:hypothetical protein